MKRILFVAVVASLSGCSSFTLPSVVVCAKETACKAEIVPASKAAEVPTVDPAAGGPPPRPPK